MADEIEAANKIRISLGLAPIPVPSSTSNGPTFKQATPDEDEGSTYASREAAAEDNFRKVQEEERNRQRKKAQKEAIRKAKEAAARNIRLAGPTLGDDDDGMDTLSWLKGQKQRQKEIEKQRQREAEELEREKKNQAQYTSKDMAGLKVGHEFDQFEAGDEHILTLKDAEIGDETEDDELENADLKASEARNKKLELKKKKPIYDPNQDDGEGGVLKQYDEEKRHQFTLDGMGSTVEKAKQLSQIGKKPANGLVISLDILKDDTPISDYAEAKPAKFKKTKKKSSKSSRTKAVEDSDIFPTPDEEANLDGMEIDLPKVETKKRSYRDANFVDDDDLQSKIASQRLEAQKKRRRMRPEDLAELIREEQENGMEEVIQEEEPGGLILDETTEFVSRLNPQELEEQSRPKSKTTSTQPEVPEPDSDTEMADTHTALNEKSPVHSSPPHEPNATMGLDEEEALDQGVAATLNMLRNRHLVDDVDAASLNTAHQSTAEFIAHKAALHEKAERDAKMQRERDRMTGREDHRSARERQEAAQRANQRREQMEARAVADLYAKEYKPNVELKYTDEFGRNMNAKEAFKHLSHQFHGKGSGKGKYEKRLKKVAEEKKREAASLLGAGDVLGSSKGKDGAKRAGVRLQ